MKFELPAKLLNKLPDKAAFPAPPKAKTRIRPPAPRGLTAKDKSIIKTIILVIFMFIATFEGLFFYINSQIKPQSYEAQIIDDIKKQTGQNVEIKGGVRFSLLPSPKLIISELILGDTSEGSNSPVFNINAVEIHISSATILSDRVTPSSITLINPELRVKRYEDNVIHWDWLNTRLLKLLNNKDGNAISLPIYIVNGTVNYHDIANNKTMEIQNIEAHSLIGSQSTIEGSLMSGGRKFNFMIDGKTEDGIELKETEFPLNIQLSEGGSNSLKVNGIIDPSGDLPKIFGKFAFNTTDIDNFLDLISTMNSQAGATGDKEASPVIITGAWNLDNDAILMNDLDVQAMNSKGNGTASISWTKWYPTIDTDLDFEQIDYLSVKSLLERRIIKRVPKKTQDFLEDDNQSYDFRKQNPLPENIEIKLNIRAQKVMFNKEVWKNTSMNAILDNGAFTINQIDIQLNGDGVLSIFGVVSQGGTGELRFEGNIESSGKSLREAISMFYSSAKDLPPLSLGEFDFHANMYITAGQIRLFETRGVIDNVNIEGTITIYLEAILRLDMALKLEDVNFDYIRDTLREKKKEADAVKNKPRRSTDNDFGLDWLKYLSIRLDAKVIIERFTFMERAGDRATFSLYAHRGDLRLSDFQLQYPDITDELNCNLDARGKLPFINLMINFDKLDTSYFNLNPNASDNEPPPDQSRKDLLQKESLNRAVPLDWMDGFNGVFDITLGKLIHKNLIMDKIKLQAKLDNKKVTMQKFGFIFSQAQSYVVGTLYGGKVPGMNISFTMANADLYDVINPLTGLDNISGFANLSGNISTSGWSFLEWLQHSDSKFLLAARGVKIQGINLDGVTNVVEVARSSADVYNNVNNVLTKGTTEFSVDGPLNVKDGELRAPNLSLRAGLITGAVMGGVNLENMEGQFSSTFRFPNLSSDLIPYLIIQLDGNMNKPALKVDTASLEAFVAKRNIIK